VSWEGVQRLVFFFSLVEFFSSFFTGRGQSSSPSQWGFSDLLRGGEGMRTAKSYPLKSNEISVE
jgi:hypothetical protein